MRKIKLQIRRKATQMVGQPSGSPTVALVQEKGDSDFLGETRTEDTGQIGANNRSRGTWYMECDNGGQREGSLPQVPGMCNESMIFTNKVQAWKSQGTLFSILPAS